MAMRRGARWRFSRTTCYSATPGGHWGHGLVFPITPKCSDSAKNFVKTSPVRATAYVEKRCWTGFDRGPRLTAALLTTGAYVTSFVGLGGRTKRQRCESSCWLHDRMGCVAAAAVEFGGGFRDREAGDGVGPCGLWPRPPAPRQGLALCVRGRSRGGSFPALGLAAVFFNVAPDIDRWLAPRQPSLRATAASFRFTNVATLALALAGGSLALSCFERHRLAATLLGGLAGTIAVFVLLGYLTGIDTLYGAASVGPPALPTTVCLLSIAGGIVIGIGAMPAFRKPRPLWHLLTILGCAIIAPLLLFGVYTGFSIGDARFDEVRRELSSEARTLSAQVDRDIIGEIGRLEALAASPALRQGDYAAFQRQAEARSRSTEAAISCLSIATCTSSSTPGCRSVPLWKRPLF
jgi:hypothetical protein